MTFPRSVLCLLLLSTLTQTSQAVTWTTVDVPGAYSTLGVWDINNNGVMVGLYVDASDVEHAFEYDMNTGTFTVIDPPGSFDAQAGGINNLGAIVGYNATQADGNLAFLLSNGTYQNISYPSSLFTRPYDINDSGEVVGSVLSPKGNRTRAFVYQNGKFARLNFPGADITIAYGVNNAAAIVGTYAGNTNVVHGFVRTP